MMRFVTPLLCLAAAAAHAQPPVEYHVDLSNASAQIVDITMTIREVDRPTIEVALPAWRPGKYLILDPSGSVRWLRAVSGSGAPLDVEKTRKSVWRIETGGADTIALTYRLYCNSINDRTRHADDTHAFLSGSSVFLFEPSRREHPIVVTIDGPPAWRVATGLAPDPNRPGTFHAASYDVLVDSPIEVGEHDVFEFIVDDVPHEIVIWGDADYDRQRLADDFEAIVRDQLRVFGRLPFERYVFLIHIGPGMRGGTEHLNSTIMQASRNRLEDPDPYEGFLGLVSHEYFHVWNVKQVRPAGLAPYDYLQENYTKLLWLAEGTTSYYDDLTLARTELVEIGSYLDGVASSIASYRRQPGRHIQSLEASSFDAWVKFNRHTADRVNDSVNFYQKGALVSMLLDLTIRESSGGKASLDDVMRDLFERFPLGGPGVTPDDVIEASERAAGTDLDQFFASYVRGTDPLPLEDALATAGLELVIEPNEDPWSDDDDEDQPLVDRAYLGLDLNEDRGRITVRSVRSDGPAYAAGVIAGDEVIAINERRVSERDIDPHRRALDPGDDVRVVILRGDELRTITFEAGAEPDGTWKLRRVEDPTDAQIARYESWLGLDWPEDEDD